MTAPRKAADTRPTPRALGSIRADELMPSAEFRRRLGLGMRAWRQLLARGLPTIRAGKQAFVDGAAALTFFRGLAETEGQQG